MKLCLCAVLLALLAAMALGWGGQSSPAGARAADLIQPVSPSWYRTLPRDPALATRSFLDRVPPAMRARGEAVSRSRYWALAARVVANVGCLLLFLRSGAAAQLDAATGKVSRHRWLRDLIFSAGLLAFQFVLVLPVEVVASFLRYRAFGFSDQPFAGWLEDDVMGWLGTFPFYAVGIAVLMAIIRRRPRTWFLWAGLVYLVLAALYTAATPQLIEPLTNSYVPLPDSPLKRDILALAAQAGIRADDVYTDDASRQSRRLNGHVSGAFGQARITIDDTALGADPTEVEALAAHEMGHYAMSHPMKMVLFASLVAIVGFYLISRAAPWLLRRYAGAWRLSTLDQVGGIAVLWMLFTGWVFVSDPITNIYARVQEAQADAFSLTLAKAPEGLAEFMIQDADIARLEPTALDILLFYDHPSDASRVEHAMRWRAQNTGTNR